jgi:hypothetical protein
MSGDIDFRKGMMKIVETDNFGGDYPDEKFVNIPYMNKEQAQKIADVINDIHCGPHSSRYWKVVEYGYVLQPGFEP